MKRPSQTLADFLRKKKLTIAFAESITCGLAAHRLGTVSGTSDFFIGSIVCYDESVKTSLLKIKETLLQKYSAESQEVTDALSKNLKQLINADIHVAITGLASPGGSETATKPVGTVFYSICFKKRIYRMRKKFNGSPLAIKKKACDELYKLIVNRLR
jgi:nicotinamide-nucleotide amidase